MSDFQCQAQALAPVAWLQPALTKAAMYGQKEIVQLLLGQQDVMVNGVDADGETALMVAATVGHKSIVEMLLQKNADVNKQDDDGSTALIYASLYGHNDIVRLLLTQGAKVNLHNRYDSLLRNIFHLTFIFTKQ